MNMVSGACATDVGAERLALCESRVDSKDLTGVWFYRPSLSVCPGSLAVHDPQRHETYARLQDDLLHCFGLPDCKTSVQRLLLLLVNWCLSVKIRND